MSGLPLRVFALLAWAGFFLSVGCSKPVPPAAELTIEHQVAPQPARVGPVTITLKLANGAKSKVAGAQIDLEADMSHPGMTPVFGEAKEIEAGLYRGQLDLGMAGDWVILLHIVLPNGQKLERQIELPSVRPS